jgi:hypothetical protein
MAGTTIGEVNINLRMSLAQFKQDVKDGTAAAGSATQDMSRTIGANVTEARGTLSLLGEEIGVTIPRHLQTFIAQIPGVGTALNAAFSSVAVLALLELVVKLADKLDEFQKHAEAVRDKLEATGVLGADAMRKINEETLSLDAQIQILSQNYLGALADQLKLIDSQTLTHITDQFRSMSADILKDLDAIKVGWAQSLVGLGNDKQIEGIQKDIKQTVESVNELNKAGNNTEIGAVLAAALERVNIQLRGSADLAKNVVQALQIEKTYLEDQVDKYKDINANAAKSKQLAEDQAAIQQKQADLAYVDDRNKETEEVNKLRDATSALAGVQQSETDKTIQKIDDLIKKWQDHDAQLKAEYPGITTFFDGYIAKLTQAKQLLEEHNAAQAKLLAAGIVPGTTAKAPNLSGGEATPSFGGTTDQLNLEKIKTDSAAAAVETQKVEDSIETQNQKFERQKAILDELRAQGKLTEDEYTRAIAVATAAADKGNHVWQKLGEEIGQNILAVAELKESWGQALTSILEDILKVILQLEVMKALSAVGGGGGFLGSLVSGLFGGGKAAGGPVYSDQTYLVGENGPELFTPGASGRITPNGGAGGGATVVYQIDARGAQAGVSDEVQQALKKTEDRAVARAVVTTREIGLRRSS